MSTEYDSVRIPTALFWIAFLGALVTNLGTIMPELGMIDKDELLDDASMPLVRSEQQ